MDVKTAHDPAHSRRVCVPITIQQVSPEGIGLSVVGDGGLVIKRGSTVTVRFPLRGHDLAIPGKIAWYGPERSSACHAGISLHLHLAQAVHRQIYAEWVVNLIRSRPAQ